MSTNTTTVNLTDKKMAGNFSAENSSYHMSGDYKVKEDGTLFELSASVYGMSEGVESMNTYASVNIYTNGSERKVNLNSAELSNIAGISSLLDEAVAQIESNYKKEA